MIARDIDSRRLVVVLQLLLYFDPGQPWRRAGGAATATYVRHAERRERARSAQPKQPISNAVVPIVGATST